MMFKSTCRSSIIIIMTMNIVIKHSLCKLTCIFVLFIYIQYGLIVRNQCSLSVVSAFFVQPTRLPSLLQHQYRTADNNVATLSSNNNLDSSIWRHHVYVSTPEKQTTKMSIIRLNAIPKNNKNNNIDERDAQIAIKKVVNALQKDKVANIELGRLEKVTTIVGYGCPTIGTIAVRFNAAFQRTDRKGMSSIPLPFGLGQSNVQEGRGTMVGQVKASLDTSTGKIISCSVFRDLGYGRAFNLKV